MDGMGGMGDDDRKPFQGCLDSRISVQFPLDTLSSDEPPLLDRVLDLAGRKYVAFALEILLKECGVIKIKGNGTQS